MTTLRLLLLSSIVGLLLVAPFKAVSPQAYNSVPELVIEQGNTLRAIATPAYLPPILNTQVLGCLVHYESSGNPKAVGDNGKAYGILQFWETTFDMFCNKYGLNLDYKDPNDQMRLADRMIGDGYGFHWSTWKHCVQ